MANVSPPRIVRAPVPAGDEDAVGPALREAFRGRYERLPMFLEQLLARLGLRR
jgi:hypothetical protein